MKYSPAATATEDDGAGETQIAAATPQTTPPPIQPAPHVLPAGAGELAGRCRGGLAGWLEMGL